MNKEKKTDEEIKMEIGLNISRLRRSTRNFLSAKKVAQALGISREALTHIENGRNNVNAVTLWKLSCILGCDVVDFFPGTPQGFQLNKRDVKEIEKREKQAVRWAEDLFGSPLN